MADIDTLTRAALERATASLRPELESILQSLADEVARVVTEERVRVAVREAESALDAARRAADAKLTEVSADADRQLADLQETLSTRIITLERQLVEVRSSAETEARTNQFEAEKEHRAELASAVEDTQAEARQATLAGVTRQVESIHALDEAESLKEVLSRLGEGANREAERVAVFVVKDGRLQGWSFLGFDSEMPAPGELNLDPDDGGLLGEVMRTSAPVVSHAGEESDSRALALPPFVGDGAGRQAVALPVLVGGTVVAVLYGDAAGPDVAATSSWPLMLDVLTRHASRILEGIMVAQASGVTIPRTLAR
jgi:hypothetical protein